VSKYLISPNYRRHWSAARDGSLILLWANWSQWPAGKTLSNLKFLAHLVLLPDIPETYSPVSKNVAKYNFSPEEAVFA
jgi:hypothetical protein